MKKLRRQGGLRPDVTFLLLCAAFAALIEIAALAACLASFDVPAVFAAVLAAGLPATLSMTLLLPALRASPDGAMTIFVDVLWRPISEV